MIIRIVALGLLAVSVIGCDQGPTYAEKFDEREAESQLQAELFCECYDSFAIPFADPAECEAFFFIPTEPDMRQCLLDAAVLYPTSSEEYIDCELDAMRAATECLTVNLDCALLNDAIALCSAEQEQALELCKPLPPPVQTAISACSMQE